MPNTITQFWIGLTCQLQIEFSKPTILIFMKMPYWIFCANGLRNIFYFAFHLHRYYRQLVPSSSSIINFPLSDLDTL